MKQFIYKYLPIIFGCHCKAERSFTFYGKQFPICARCTGELVGMIVVSITYAIYHPPILYGSALLIPMIADGGIQLFTTYESTNYRRFFTGLLFGYGFFQLFIASAIATFLYGYHFLQ